MRKHRPHHIERLQIKWNLNGCDWELRFELGELKKAEIYSTIVYIGRAWSEELWPLLAKFADDEEKRVRKRAERRLPSRTLRGLFNAFV